MAAVLSATVGTLLAVEVGVALPQDALGSGRALDHPSGSGSALDRNLQHGSGGRNTGPVQEDLRARNLVVTGNVAGGRGFRGDVGYTADRDFRGSTSDDASFDFRAGSAFSDPRLLRAGSMGDRMAVGRSYGNIEYGRSSITGSVVGADLIGTRLRVDHSTSSLSTPMASRAISDVNVASTFDTGDGGRVRLLTGDFTGVRTAQQRAYIGVQSIQFDGMQYRNDIGYRAIKRGGSA